MEKLDYAKYTKGKKKYKGKLIVIEGNDGAGKSIQANILKRTLETRCGVKVWLTSEPTNSNIGYFIRNELLSGNVEINSKNLNILFASDRLEHVIEKYNGILKHLIDGDIVICDRYYLSSMAYYGLSNYEVYRYPHTSIADDFEFIWNLNSLSRKLCQPDLIIFLDVIKETALKRLEEREGKKAEIYDNISNFSRVHTLYMSAIDFARNYGDKIVILDANGSLADVGNDIFNTVRKECKIPISKFHDKYCH